MTNNIQHINPSGLSKNPAFSQIVSTKGKGQTIYIGGQNAVNSDRELVGKNDLQVQTKQVMQNIQTAVSACGGTFGNIVRLGIHIVQGQNAIAAFTASQEFFGQAPEPPVITVLFVSALINPDFLIEIDATAFIPEE